MNWACQKLYDQGFGRVTDALDTAWNFVHLCRPFELLLDYTRVWLVCSITTSGSLRLFLFIGRKAIVIRQPASSSIMLLVRLLENHIIVFLNFICVKLHARHILDESVNHHFPFIFPEVGFLSTQECLNSTNLRSLLFLVLKHHLQ